MAIGRDERVILTQEFSEDMVELALDPPRGGSRAAGAQRRRSSCACSARAWASSGRFAR